MDALLNLMPLSALLLAFLVTLTGGFVKGALGFAMPLVMISGMGIFLDPQIIVAGIVVPILLTNILQVVRGGLALAVDGFKEHFLFVLTACVMILLAAQLLPLIPEDTMFVALGLPVVVLCFVQLIGWRPTIDSARRRPFTIVAGFIAGTFGGLTGTWGPPTVLYLLALDTPKARQLSVQGVIFGLGSCMLLLGHLMSGVLRAETLPFSLAMVVPALIGMYLGFWAGDKLDQARFRRVTLVVLAVAGANLIRRGLMG
jgi:uncharacterized membrane protein YfcA